MLEFNNTIPKNEPERKVSKKVLVEKFLYDEILARKEKYIETVKKSDIVYYFLQAKEKYPQVTKCLVCYKNKGSRYLVTLIPLEDDNKEIRLNNKMCIGKTFVVDYMDNSVLTWFGTETSKLMTSDNIM